MTASSTHDASDVLVKTELRQGRARNWTRLLLLTSLIAVFVGGVLLVVPAHRDYEARKTIHTHLGARYTLVSIGPNWVHTVADRSWVKTHVPDQMLSTWKNLFTRIETVHIQRHAMPREDVDLATRTIAGLDRLKVLRIDGCKLSEVDCGHIAQADSLENLLLSRCELTDAGMSEIAKLHSLVVLDLNRTNVTDEGVKQLGTLPRLERLILEQTAVSDVGLAGLVSLTNLKCLHLDRTAVTAAGVEQCTTLSRLEELDIRNIVVTDHLLESLRRMPVLRTVLLDLDSLSEEAKVDLSSRGLLVY